MASDLATKPLDIGNGLIASSVAADAGVLVVGIPHARLGYAAPGHRTVVRRDTSTRR